MKADRAQLAKIHIAKKQLGIEEEDYRKHLLDFGVASSKDLTYAQANAFIAMYMSGGFAERIKPKTEAELKSIEQYGTGRNKYRNLDKRSKEYARSSKLRKIEVLWREVSETKTDESLRNFIENKVHVSHLTMLFNEHANVIITALENMKPRKAQRNKVSYR